MHSQDWMWIGNSIDLLTPDNLNIKIIHHLFLQYTPPFPSAMAFLLISWQLCLSDILSQCIQLILAVPLTFTGQPVCLRFLFSLSHFSAFWPIFSFATFNCLFRHINLQFHFMLFRPHDFESNCRLPLAKTEEFYVPNSEYLFVRLWLNLSPFQITYRELDWNNSDDFSIKLKKNQFFI